MTEISVSVQYENFLKVLGKNICDFIQSDESIATLKQMEQKSYLFERISEIIQCVYQTQTQKKIIQLLQEINALKNNGPSESSEKYFKTKNQSSSRICKNRQRQWTFGINTNSGQKQPNNLCQSRNFDTSAQPGNRTASLMGKQHIQLQSQLAAQELQNKTRVRQLLQTIKVLENEHIKLKENSQKKIISSVEMIGNWQGRYLKLYQQKCSLQTSLESYIDKLAEEKYHTNQLSRKLEQLDIQMERIQSQGAVFKEERDQACSKSKQIQQQNLKLKKQYQSLAEQIQLLKKINKRFNEQDNNQNQFSGHESNPNEYILANLQLNHLKSQLSQKDEKIFQLQKKISKLRSTQTEIQDQAQAYKLNNQKQKSKLEHDFHVTKLNLEKQIRVQKEEYFSDIQKRKQQSLRQIRSMEQSLAQQRQNLIKQSQQIRKKLVEKNSELSQRLEEKQKAMKEHKTFYTQKIEELQCKIDSLKTNTNQLEHTLVSKNNICQEINQESKLKSAQLEEAIKYLKDQNATLKAENQNKKTQIERLKQNQEFKNMKQDINCNAKESAIIFSDQENTIKQYKKTIEQLTKNQNILSGQLSHLSKDIKHKSDQKAQAEMRQDKLSQKYKKLQRKLQESELQLSKLKQQIKNTENINQSQLKELCQKHESKLQEVKNQLKNHYKVVIQDKDQKINELVNNSQIAQYKSIISNFKDILSHERQSYEKLKYKHEKSQKSLGQKNSELVNIQHQNQKLISQIKKIDECLKDKNKKLTQTIMFFKQKQHYLQVKFRQFKHEFYQYLMGILKGIKQEQKQIKHEVSKIKKYYAEFIEELNVKMCEKVVELESKHNNEKKQIRDYYQKDIILKMQIDKQQMQYSYDRTSKQNLVELMAVLAQKQHQLKLKKQQQNVSKKILEELSQKYQIAQKSLLKLTQKYESLQNIQQKIDSKNTFLQKKNIQLSHLTQSLAKRNDQIQRQMRQNKINFQQRLEKCREKYLSENQQLFGKYEKQFDKLIRMNSKGKLQQIQSQQLSSHTLTAVSSPTCIGNNHQQIPTKENQVVSSQSSKKYLKSSQKDSKLQTIKKEIMIQKNKLHNLDSTLSNKKKLSVKKI